VTEPAELVILGARVHTLCASRPQASAVAISGGMVCAVGEDDEVRDTIGPRTEVLDGAGLTVVPGLVDAHDHPFHGASLTRGVDLTGVRDLHALSGRLASAREHVEHGGWLLGWGLRYDLFEGSGIHAGLIEEATAGVPAALNLFDDHTLLANGAALAIAGVEGARAFVQGASVVCDERGRPTGELKERAAMQLVLEAVPSCTPGERRRDVLRVLADHARLGLTGAHAMLGDPELLATCDQLEQEDQLTLRLRVPLWIQPETSDEEVDELLSLCDARGHLWEAGAAKFFLDGVIESGTAWLHGGDVQGRSDSPFWPDPDRYATLVARFARAGFQCATHAVGDAAVTAALDAYADAAPPARGMHRIEHIELLARADLPRFARQEVCASMQPLHMSGVEDHSGENAWRAALREEQLGRGFPAGDLLRAGAVLALGSDWPVAPLDPRIGMAWACLRRAPGRPELDAYRPDQRLDVLQALHGYTTEPARVAGFAGARGQIRRGASADVTVFAEDPLCCTPGELPDVAVALTVVGGRVVHRIEP
jgi:predicted amidohydrolase YtcJ